jgi:hypothetical protein
MLMDSFLCTTLQAELLSSTLFLYLEYELFVTLDYIRIVTNFVSKIGMWINGFSR